MITIDGATLRELVPPAEAAHLIERALADGLDPEADAPRSVTDVPAGQVLCMPAAVPGYAGVKIVTIAPANPDSGLPRIQGQYLLFDGSALTPLALLDGIELTSIRTPAVSAVAVRHLAEPDARRLVVFGTGPQAWGHVAAIGAVRPLEHVAVVGRGGTEEFVARCRAAGVPAVPAEPAAVAGADIIACCTTARTGLFPGKLVADHAVVVAVGSHEPDSWEVDGGLVARATVVVESRAAALREAGDLIQPMRVGHFGPDHLAGTLVDLLAGRVSIESRRPRFFKSVGMAWEDLVVAAAAYERFPR